MARELTKHVKNFSRYLPTGEFEYTVNWKGKALFAHSEKGLIDQLIEIESRH